MEKYKVPMWALDVNNKQVSRPSDLWQLADAGSNFHEVLNALLHLHRDFVKPPSGEVPSAIRNDVRRWPYFKDCVGALDGSHFLLHVPASEQKRFRNRHGDLSHNVLAVVDFELNFMYILPGWEGSAHDGRVLKDAQMKGFGAPDGKYYLADAGYANSNMLLTPYRGVRYHLREIAQMELRPRNQEELFNFRHSSLRNAVERCFGLFKRRWRIFDRPHEFSIKTQVKLVLALAGVHNFINRESGVADDLDKLKPYESERREAFLRDLENMENLGVVGPEMSEFRDKLAQSMWDNYLEAQKVVEGA